jgi:hypothetical protein
VIRRRRFLKWTLSGPLLWLAAAGGCQKEPSAAAPGGGDAASSDEQDNDPRALAVELVPITPLLPRLPTHVAVDLRGNLYWIQESNPTPAGGDLVFVMGEGGVPQTIPALSVPSLLQVLAPGGAAGATGAVKSIAIGPEDRLYVLFVGGKGRTPIFAVVEYTPGSARTRVVADTKRLASETGMDASIDLARGTLLNYKRDLWLWARHSDGGAVLQIDVRENTTEVRRVILKPPRGVGSPISEQEDMAAGPDGLLYYLDRPRALLWKISTRTGFYTPVQSLEGLSRAVAAPAADDRGRVALLAGDGDPLVAREYAGAAARSQTAEELTWAKLTYPALVQLKPGSTRAPIVTASRDDFHAPPALPVQDLQPRQLLLDPSSGTLITFDAGSGELLRVRILAK